MADPIDLLEVGRIGKAHGLRGEVVVTFTSERAERRAPGSVFTTDSGELEVASARPHQDKWLITFTGLADRTGAEALRGLVLYAAPLVDGDTLWVHELIGCAVIDTDDVERGQVVEVLANPASDLLVLDDDTLVPIRFVTDGPTDGVLTVDAPDGLFDLEALEGDGTG